MRNCLQTVKQILEADIYEIVDLKVKIISKSQSKQSVVKNQVSMQKIETIVANDSGTIKLILTLANAYVLQIKLVSQMMIRNDHNILHVLMMQFKVF